MKKPLTSFYGVLIPAGFLGVLGLIMVFSASSVKSLQQSGTSIGIVGRQALLFLVGIILAFLIIRLPLKILERLGRLSIILSALILALPQIPELGKEVNGNRNWIEIAGFTIQPSEFAKVGFIIWIASVLSRFEAKKLRGEVNDLAKEIIPGIILIIGLILLGEDLGTAIVFAAIAAGLIFVAGIPLRWFALGLAGVFSVVLVAVLTQPNRIYRIKALLDPFSDENYQNAGWQPAHSIMGLASGGIFGSGLGASKQKWGNLAEAHTDFIFAVIGEEMGLLGTLTVLFLLGFLLLSIFRISLRANSLFERYLAAGIGIWLLVQIAINIGSVTGVIPVIGVTLPLISYGGSSLIANLVGLGLLIGVAIRDPKVHSELAARAGARTKVEGINRR
jgi:cell division protein FtsW